MGIFIKTEKFKPHKVPLESKSYYIKIHKSWVMNLISEGIKISSGYLVNSKKQPGEGGLLIIEAVNYLTALKIVKQDPMILNNLVDWELNEWIAVAGSIKNE